MGEVRRSDARPNKAAEYTRIGTGIATEVGKLAMMPNDSPTRFKGSAGRTEGGCMVGTDVAARGQGSRQDSRLFGQRHAAGVSGRGSAQLSRREGDAVDDLEVRALVPVNLRRPGDEMALGNRFGLVALELPVGIENPLARLYETRNRMEALRARCRPC